MNITVNGQTVYIDPDTIFSWLPILFPVLFFLIFFGILGAVIKNVMKQVKGQFPAGTLRELQNIRRQLPRGVTWQQLTNQWDIKVDRETGKIKIRKKTESGESTLGPTEMQVTQLAQLPQAMRQMLNVLDQSTGKTLGQASIPKPPKIEQSANPFLSEGASTILKIALGIVVLVALYTIGVLLG